MMEANLLFPNFDTFPWGANFARKHPNHQGEASHTRDRNHEWPSGLAKHVADDSPERCCRRLLHESYQRRGGASAAGNGAMAPANPCGIANPSPVR
jgi:hypothetical protein